MAAARTSINSRRCSPSFPENAYRAASAALSLEEKLAGQKQIKSLETQRKKRRCNLCDADFLNEIYQCRLPRNPRAEQRWTLDHYNTHSAPSRHGLSG